MNNMIRPSGLQTVVSIIVAVVFTFVFGSYSGLPSLALTMLLTVIFNIIIGALADRYDAGLTKRMEADAPITWDVWINDVQVGTVTDAQYAAMKRHAARDGRNAAAQLFNIGQMALSVIDKLMIAVPLTCFWTAIAMAAFSPESFIEIAQELQTSGPAAITTVVRSFMQAGVLVFAILVAIMVAMGLRLGFKNCYAVAVNRMLRRHCNTPVEGDVRLSRQISDDLATNS